MKKSPMLEDDELAMANPCNSDKGANRSNDSLSQADDDIQLELNSDEERLQREIRGIKTRDGDGLSNNRSQFSNNLSQISNISQLEDINKSIMNRRKSHRGRNFLSRNSRLIKM